MAAIFAGDDFFALVHVGSEVFALENDFSKFDRTQGVHALGAECRVLVELGMSRKQARLLFQTQLASPRYQVERYEIKRRLPMPPQRATGGPDTTIGNTLTNMMSVLYSVWKSNGVSALERCQLELGFLAKLQVHTDLTQATFLKGWWLPTFGDYQWLPLPSQVVKIGKIMTKPTHIFKMLKPLPAWRAAASSMAASYGVVPFDYPLFGMFLLRYTQLSSHVVDLTSFFPDLKYRVRRDDAQPIDRIAALEAMEHRYGLTVQDIEAMEEEIMATAFPGLLVHHGWGIVARRDYA